MAITPIVGAGYIVAVKDLAAQINAGGSSVQANDITDSTAVGRAVITAVDAAAARTAIGAVNAVAASTSVAGIAKQITFTAQAATFVDLAAATAAYNGLLTKLITAGIMPAS
jgi:hypothetical protein